MKNQKSAWYNTRKGVRKSLRDLESFVRLVDERAEAHYERGERLKEFKVLDGRYWLDSCGNVWKHVGDETYSANSDLPLPELRCKVCNNGWSIENIDDIVVQRDTQVFPLTGFVGRTLKDVKNHYGDLIDAIYIIQPDVLIRNDAHIDLSPKYPNADDDYQKSIMKNERGWLGSREGITDEYVIQEGDEGFFNVQTYFHRDCNRKDLERTYRERFEEVFREAGFEDVTLTPTINRYCGCDHCAPWYVARTNIGDITIGWRKRVINIDWGTVSLGSAEELFADEDVTKGEASIHAWGYNKAREYLMRIRGTAVVC